MQPFDVTAVPLFGQSLVDASAGTGKTYAIATLFVRLLLETPYRVGQILVVTFTEAATAELRSRVRARLREALRLARNPDFSEGDDVLRAIVARAGDSAATARCLERAVRELDGAEISTIHGFCQRVLQQRAFQSDVTFDSELFGDPRPRIDEIVLDFWARSPSLASPVFLEYLRAQSFGPAAARQLAHAASRCPGARRLPEREASPPQVVAQPESISETTLERLRDAIEHARAIWQRHDVASLVLEAPGLNRNRYKRNHVPGWVAKVNEFFARESTLLPRAPDCLKRFDTTVLTEAGALGLADHPALRASDAVLQELDAVESALEAQLTTLKLDMLEYVDHELRQRTRQAGQMSFDDLLLHLKDALNGEGGGQLAADLRSRYPAALIDEFQDTDPTQLAIFSRIYQAPRVCLFLIGDPKQAIYSFRGADVFSYVRAAQATSTNRRYTMTTNYRSDPSMVAAVNAVFSNAPRPFLLEGIPFRTVSARPGATDALQREGAEEPSGLDLLWMEAPAKNTPGDSPAKRIPAVVARDVRSLLRTGTRVGEKRLTPSDVAVLTRTNDQAFEIQSALREVHLPSVVIGDKSVYASAEAAELERVLSAVLEPTNERLIRAALATELLGLDACQLVELSQDDAGWEAWLEDFRELSSIWLQTGFVQMFRSLMDRRSVRARVLARLDAQRRLTNLVHLSELLHSAAREGHLGPSSLLALFRHRRHQKTWGMEAEAAQIRLESDADAIQITTMHRSKGLEYPIVYCPFLWHGTLLHRSDERALKFHDAQGHLVVDVGSPDRQQHLELARREQFAENLRLLYVALTRARHRTVVSWGRIEDYATSALGYLLHPPPETSDLAQIRHHLKARSEEELLQDVQALGGAAPVRIRREGDPQPREPAGEPDVPRGALRARRPDRWIDNRHRISSFSALTTGASPSPASEALVRDHDAAEAAKSYGAPAETSSELRLAAFPRGAKAGSFFHDVLEHYAFESPRRAALEHVVDEKLALYQYSAPTWRTPVCDQIFDVLDTPLHAGGDACLRLADVRQEQRLTELEFCLPVSPGAESSHPRDTAIVARQLAEVFAEHKSEVVPDSYPSRLAQLEFSPLRGFLRGYVDLVAEYQGRYYLFDYKANHLGSTVSDFGPRSISEAMLEGHYFLQYHVYALALHRYLAHRLRDYAYDEHFGGVFYLFIKGMAPEHGGAGVFFEKPPYARLDALSRLVGPTNPNVALTCTA